MLELDEKSNANAWELEITCKNKEYLDKVVLAILEIGMLSFKVENVECIGNHPEWDGRYTVLIWCHWFSNLHKLTSKLKKIESKFIDNGK